ncbi:hypothetical protein ACFT5D_05015 [Streptomyces sp. NPDC057144]|uniref:hypothetical protein n=1 Tax=Streptomyces TaxID=1883 RepID=UPI002852D159|nr:hypothetical protein [Streptomyces salinarius]
MGPWSALPASYAEPDPPAFPVAAIDDRALPEVLAELAPAHGDQMDADTMRADR